MNAVVLNDSKVEAEELGRIESALNREFESTKVRFFPPWFLLVKQLETTAALAEVIAQVLAASPDLVLVDAHMPNERDGVRVVDAMRRAGYNGFAYLWSGGPPSDVSEYPDLFGFPGAGGFDTTSSQPESALAADVRSSWDKLGSFVIPDARERVLRDPLEVALAILCEVQTGLWRTQLPGATAQEWNSSVKRAKDLFDTGPESFCVVASSRSRDIDGLTTALSVLGKLARAQINEPGKTEELLAKLRDVLLGVVESYD